MRTIQDFLEIVDSICKRPQMYVCGRSFYEVCAFLLGYSSAMDAYPFGDDDRGASFNTFVTTRLSYPHKLAWPYVLRIAARTDKDAFDLLRGLLTEYIGAVKDDRVGDLIADARTVLEALKRDPPEQVKFWHKFSYALNRGNKDVLQSLILSSENANVLWESEYPDEVAPIMDQIEESYAIPVVSQSEDGSVAEILSPDYGLLRLERVDGQWRIDAEPIIRFRLASRENA